MKTIYIKRWDGVLYEKFKVFVDTLRWSGATSIGLTSPFTFYFIYYACAPF